MDPVELSLFANRISAICEEMGATLKRSAFSPNIRDRLDFSCALFDPSGELIGQSAAIPVHLGSMAFAMREVTQGAEPPTGEAGEAQLVFNDPYAGGTHLPDVTVVMPIFLGNRVLAYAANRAHHADIGADSPGSMPISRSIDEEGLRITPRWMEAGSVEFDEMLGSFSRPRIARGDFAAQFSANRTGMQRLRNLVNHLGCESFAAACAALNDYGERLARAAVGEIPDGTYRFRDVLDDDGTGTRDIPIALRITVDDTDMTCDFDGTSAQVPGNVNSPVAVTAAGVFFVLRCLMPDHAPNCGGCLRPLHLKVPPGSLLNPEPGAAVAAGNVETSTRIVDVVCGALSKALPDRVPAAAQGTMNNLAMGARGEAGSWDYYETMGGGYGGGPRAPGASAVHSHMTNTLNTPVEVAERNYPIRIERYAIRRNSGGDGMHPGGDGLIRTFRFLDEATVSLITERRSQSPWGLAGGRSGARGHNALNGQPLPAKVCIRAATGDILTVETPGGGGWGSC